jgi:outer membrane putative beta-barrel porin/alpha-amylase
MRVELWTHSVLVRILPLLLLLSAGSLRAQDLDPRAYAVTPTGVNVLGIGFGRTWGDVNFDPSLPVSDVTARLGAVSLGYYRSLDFFGRSANIRVAFPYGWGHLEGLLQGQFTTLDRYGLIDSRVQFTVNLLGAPAMARPEILRYRPKTNLFASFTVIIPDGNYHSDRLINIGSNRWAFKPEIAWTQALGRWTVEAYAGVWFFTTNRSYYPAGTSERSQDPLASYQGHVSYTFRPGLWAAFDATYYSGGLTSVNGVPKNDRQSASRAGLTLNVPIAANQAIKAQFARTTTIRVGGKFNVATLSYSYAWYDK